MPQATKISTLSRTMGLALAICLPLPTLASDAADLFWIENFSPPAGKADKFCTRDLSVQVGEDWLPHWVGAQFQPARMDEVRSDFKRLQDHDAERWRPEIERAVAWLKQNDPRYTDQVAAGDLVSLYLKIGLSSEIASQDLFPTMMGDGTNLSSAQMLRAAEFLMSGTATEADPELARMFLAQAGLGGNPLAVLQLVELQRQGVPLPGWDVGTDIALSLAMSGSIGDTSTDVCDGAARVARMFEVGAGVPAILPLAESWYRFAAAHGDASAARRVVKLHEDAFDIQRDVDVMMDHMHQAADAGSTSAKLLLARTLETGAIVPRDLDGALAIYRELAEADDDTGRVRLASFIEDHGDLYPDLHDLRIENLKKLSEIDDARGWVFTHLARDVLRKKGRWIGAAEAEELFTIAVERGDLTALRDLADLLLVRYSDPATRNRALDLYERALISGGDPIAAAEIAAVHICRRPGGPDSVAAQYWNQVAASTNSQTQPLEEDDIFDEIWLRQPNILARLQTRAMNGVPRALANYESVLFLAPGEVAGDRLALQARIDNDPEALRFQADYRAAAARNDRDRDIAISTYHRAVAAGDTRAAVKLAEIMLKTGTGQTSGARQLLLDAAASGDGRAMFRLGLMDERAGLRTRGEAYEDYAEIIRRDGDFRGLLYAMEYGPDELFSYHYDRAVSRMSCDFAEVIALSDLFERRGNMAEMDRWSKASHYLVGNNPHRLVDLGDREIERGEDGDRRLAIQYYEQAFAAGEPLAISRLMRIYGDGEAEHYSPARAADMLIELLNSNEKASIRVAIEQLQAATPSIKKRVRSSVNMPVMYALIAQDGHPASMREYGKHLQDIATSEAQLTEAADWHARAAAAGDSQSMLALAQMYAFGLGVPADARQAREWLEQAALSDNPRALTLLGPTMRQPWVASN